MNSLKEILIVDDEPGYRTLVNRRLKIAGYMTFMAQNGEEALVALCERPHINLVLLEVRLPVINGLNIFEIVRKDFPDKRIIVSSSLPKDQQRFLIYDADDYFEKSEDLSILIEMVDRSFNGMADKFRENERRGFKRVAVNVLANCEMMGHDAMSATHFLSFTRDLSPSGGRFIVNQALKDGQHVTISLELPINFFPLLIDGQVVWARSIQDEKTNCRGNVEVGVKFMRISSSHDEEKLKRYLSYA